MNSRSIKIAGISAGLGSDYSSIKNDLDNTSYSSVPDIRPLGFYQLKKLLALGDKRLRMILVVGEVKPIIFTDSETGKVDRLYPLFAVKEALQRLQGVDVQLEYESIYSANNTEVEEKFKNVKLRLLNRR